MDTESGAPAGRAGDAVARGAAGGCWAPDSTMYFGTDGTVRACCLNMKHTLGHIERDTIREIWDGARTQALRTAMTHEDWSLGCQQCGEAIAAGNREFTVAAQFDRYADLPVPEYPRRMDFVLSNTCNLQCEMCQGELSSSIRAKREHLPPMPKYYGDAFFEELREFLPHLEQAMFLGGEPFLAREPRRVWDLMLELGLQIPGAVVTNGTQWNERVEHYLRELPMDVAVSIDGASAPTVESLRLGVDHPQLLHNLDQIQRVVEGRGGVVTLHYCFMVQNWQELGAFLLDADRRDLPVVVITVTLPSRFSIFRLPVDEIRGVVEALEREDAAIGSRLGRNRHVWDHELDRLRRHLDELEQGHKPVWVRSVSRPPDRLTEDEQKRVAQDTSAELEQWAGQPALVVHSHEGTITDVEVPQWARQLAPDRLVGTAVDTIATWITGALGAITAYETEEIADGILRTQASFGEDGPNVHSLSIASQDGNDEVKVTVRYYCERTRSPAASA